MTNVRETQPRPAILQNATGGGIVIPCTVQCLEGKRLIIHATQRMGTSTAVSVQCEDVMFLGEIMCCSAEAAENWRLEIKVQQMLTGLQNLMNLRARLLDEGAGQQAGMTPVMAPVRKSANVWPA